jgi:general secretion pathway protein D
MAGVAPRQPNRLESTKAKTGGEKVRSFTEVASTAGSIGRSSASIRFVADEANNNLLIMATARDYEEIKAVLADLDIIPLQVHIEATIIGVLLSDELEYGVR